MSIGGISMDTSVPRPAFASRSLRRRWKVIAASILLAIVMAAAYLATHQPQFQSTSTIFLEPMTGNPYSPTTPQSRTEQLTALTTEAGLVHTDAAIRIASRNVAAEGGELGDRVADHISTEVPSNSQVININYTAGTPEQAQLGAQAMGEAYLQYRQQRSDRLLEAQIGRWDQQTDSISSMLEEAKTDLKALRLLEAPSKAEVLDLEEQIQIYASQLAQVKVDQTEAKATTGSPGDVINPASLPESPTGISPLLIIGGLLLGMAGTGVLIALLLEHLDKKVRAPDDVVAAGLQPVYGTVTPWQPGSHTAEQMEAYQQLRNGLYAPSDSTHSIILISGITPGASSGPISSGLAEALAHSRVSTIIVQADSASVLQSSFFGPGLTDLLDDSGEIDSPPALRTLLHSVSDEIQVLSIGSQPERIASLAQSPNLERVLQSLAQVAQTVVVAGPAARTSVATSFAKHCTDILLVAEKDKSTAADIIDTLDILRRQSAPVTGAVIERKSIRGRSTEPVTVAASAQLFVGKVGTGSRRGSTRADPSNTGIHAEQRSLV